ncbi:MAG: hypothetical protein GWP30_12520, partial [Actinobacteria bacterium]|nr:hypothetical protein [Actinomycetota bacterium]
MMQVLTFALGILLAVSALAIDDVVATGSFTSKAKAKQQLVKPKRVKGLPSTAALSPQISEQSRVEISRFIYQAPALEEQIAALLLPVTGSQIETTTLLTTKDKINQLFVTNGFINTGMVIPDQQIHKGALKLDFISGKISDLQISSRLKDKYISSRLEINEPFNLVQLQDALKLLEQN